MLDLLQKAYSVFFHARSDSGILFYFNNYLQVLQVFLALFVVLQFFAEQAFAELVFEPLLVVEQFFVKQALAEPVFELRLVVLQFLVEQFFSLFDFEVELVVLQFFVLQFFAVFDLDAEQQVFEPDFLFEAFFVPTEDNLALALLLFCLDINYSPFWISNFIVCKKMSNYARF